MTHSNTKPPILEYTVLIIVIIFSFWMFQQIVNPEVNFCRSLLSDLINGKKSALRHIDWENFRAMDVDVSASLSGLTYEQDQAYKLAFVKSFSFGFKQASGKAGLFTLLHPRGVTGFTDWRVYRKSEDEVMVSCKQRVIGRTLLWTVSRANRKLTGISWQ